MPKVFASHDWGTDGVTHARVKEVVTKLRARGVDVWFDETHMKGNLLTDMSSGIEACDVFLVFVTKRYISKVADGGPGDNVQVEFMHARHTCPGKMMAVRFESDLPATWAGPVGMVLGSNLYTDLSVLTDKRIDELVARLSATSSPPAVKRLPPGILHGKKAATMYDRVQRIYEVVGKAPTPDGHLYVQAQAVGASLLGTERAKKLPLCDLVSCMEREVGVVTEVPA